SHRLDADDEAIDLVVAAELDTANHVIAIAGRRNRRLQQHSGLLRHRGYRANAVVDLRRRRVLLRRLHSARIRRRIVLRPAIVRLPFVAPILVLVFVVRILPVMLHPAVLVGHVVRMLLPDLGGPLVMVVVMPHLLRPAIVGVFPRGIWPVLPLPIMIMAVVRRLWPTVTGVFVGAVLLVIP